LTAANTYSGTTTVTFGALNIQNALALGDTAAGTAVNGGSLELQGGITVAGEALSLGSAVTTGDLRNISGDNTWGGLVTLTAASRINSDSGTLTLSNVGTITGAAFGLTVGGSGNTVLNSILGTTTGGLVKDGTGKLMLSAVNTYTGATTVTAGTLVVNGSLASTAGLNVASGAFLGGSGSLASTIAGAGLVGPGNSPGILTALAVNPSAGTDFSFEMTGTGAPVWSVASASVNDVLRLTSASSPFTSPLDGSNAVNIYFQVASLAVGDTFQGGFFTDATLAQSNLLTNVSAERFNYFVKGDGSGSSVYNGVNYYTWSDYSARPGSGITDVAMSTRTVASANFATGTVTNGQVVELVIVPEPDTIIFAGIGIGMAAWSIWKRRRIAQIMRAK